VALTLPILAEDDGTLPLAEAARLFADLTRTSAVPVDSRALDRYDVWAHDHLVIGAVPVRLFKVRGRWHVLGREVRRAAAEMAAVRLDWHDLVPVTDGPTRRWRRDITQAFESTGARTPAELKRYGGLHDTPQHAEQWCDWHRIAGTLYLSLVVPEAGRWCLPRAYADLLDRWEAQEDRLLAAARRCIGCRRNSGKDHHLWRQSTRQGWVTLCPDCTAADTRPYADEMHGLRYAEVKRRGLPEIGTWRCLLCPQRAMYIDHCHDHGYVRGPLCGGCNVSERPTFYLYDVRDPKWIRHWRRCVACQERDTLPLLHLAHIGASLAIAKHRYRHGQCPLGPRVGIVNWTTAEVDLAEGRPLRLPMTCHTHRKQWDVRRPHAPRQAPTRDHIAEVAPDLTAG
jgi:hypothetical protein